MSAVEPRGEPICPENLVFGLLFCTEGAIGEFLREKERERGKSDSERDTLREHRVCVYVCVKGLQTARNPGNANANVTFGKL